MIGPMYIARIFNTFTTNLQSEAKKVEGDFVEAGKCFVETGQYIKNGCVTAAGALKEAAHKTHTFVSKNKVKILMFLVAVGVITGGMGLMYGFKAVALQVTIGIGGGLCFGVIVGILSYHVLKTEKSVWGHIKIGIDYLDEWGVRPFVIAVAVTVLLATSLKFPYVMGGVFGTVVGNDIIFKIINPGDNRTARQLMAESKERYRKLKEVMDELERKVSAQEAGGNDVAIPILIDNSNE